MNRPLIGISGSHNVADRQMFVRENYMQSVLRAGGIPVLLPEIEDEETAKAILIVWTVSFLQAAAMFCRRDMAKKRCPPAERTTRSATSSSC